jgi:hypothetical protein
VEVAFFQRAGDVVGCNKAGTSQEYNHEEKFQFLGGDFIRSSGTTSRYWSSLGPISGVRSPRDHNENICLGGVSSIDEDGVYG